MKKRNLKTLQLKKKCISKLNGGTVGNNVGDPVHYDTGGGPVTIYPPHSEGIEPGCLWYSELYSACECRTIQHSNCIECPVHHNTGVDKHHPPA